MISAKQLDLRKMWRFILIVAILHSTNGLPLGDEHTLLEIQTTTDTAEQPHKTVAVVSYIQNFKNIMAEYVNTQYRNLTTNDMETIKVTLEEFLLNFAKDLKDTVESQPKNLTSEAREVIQDGVPDATFEEIKSKMMAEFPDIQDETADEIVFKLRKNLFVTRRKIDTIINDSKKADVDFGLD